MSKILKNVLKIAVGVVAVIAVIIFGVALYAEHKMIYPPREAITVTPKDIGIDYDEIRYTTVDGLTIRGWFIPASSAASANTQATIILAHGYSHNRAQMNEYMKFLHERGFNVLSFDFRGNGESDGKYTTVGYNEQKDVDGAVEWLKANHPKESSKIGILGISMGGATAILATAHNKKIDAIVTDSSFSKLSNVVDAFFVIVAKLPAYPFSPVTVRIAEIETKAHIDEVVPVKYVADIAPRPILIIHSKVDKDILYDKNALPLYETAGNPKQLWSVDGGGHVENHSFAGKEYEERVDKFFEDSLIGTATVAPIVQKTVVKKKK